MSRVLIGPSALIELRDVEPLAARRKLVARLSRLGTSLEGYPISAGGCRRLLADGLRVLYRRRPDGTPLILAISPPDHAVDSAS